MNPGSTMPDLNDLAFPELTTLLTHLQTIPAADQEKPGIRRWGKSAEARPVEPTRILYIAAAYLRTSFEKNQGALRRYTLDPNEGNHFNAVIEARNTVENAIRVLHYSLENVDAWLTTSRARNGQPDLEQIEPLKEWLPRAQQLVKGVTQHWKRNPVDDVRIDADYRLELRTRPTPRAPDRVATRTPSQSPRPLAELQVPNVAELSRRLKEILTQPGAADLHHRRAEPARSAERARESAALRELLTPTERGIGEIQKSLFDAVILGRRPHQPISARPRGNWFP
jgi:hypothetical protein